MANLDLIQMAALYDTGELLHASLVLREVLTQATALGLRLMRARQCAIFLFDESDPSLRFQATPELSLEKETMFAPLLAEVKQSGQIVSIVHAQDDPRYQVFEASFILVAPLLVEDKLIGALYVDKEAERQPFTEGDRNLMEAYGRQVARGVRNAQVYTGGR